MIAPMDATGGTLRISALKASRENPLPQRNFQTHPVHLMAEFRDEVVTD